MKEQRYENSKLCRSVPEAGDSAGKGADRGTMDYNIVRLNAAGFHGEWIRIKDEKFADNFASKVIGATYSGYGFTSKSQESYDNAVNTLPPN